MRNRLNLMILLLAMVMVSSCNDPVGTITFESPELPDGTRELVIRATDSKGAPISGFNLQITGPTTANATVSGSQYSFTNLASGLYTIVITKEGYVGKSYQLPVQLPQSVKQNYQATTVGRITQLTPPVPVSNATGGTVQAPGPAAVGMRSQPTAFIIPPGALPGTGTTQVSVTRILPAPITQTAQPQKSTPGNSVENTINRIALDGFVTTFTLNGNPVGVFNAPITASIPLSVPSSIRNEKFEFVLMSSSAPGATPTNTSSPIVIDTNTGNGTTTIQQAGTYKVYVTLGLTTTTAQSTFTIGSTSCGLGGSFSFSSPTAGAVGPVMSFLAIVPTATSTNNTVVLDPLSGAQSTLTGVNSFIDYRVNRPTGAQLETYRYPLAQVSTAISINNCHNSGGS